MQLFVRIRNCVLVLAACGSGSFGNSLLGGVLAAEVIGEELNKAKEMWGKTVARFDASVLQELDRRQAEARKAGDKAEVDRVKAETQEFKRVGQLPSSIPTNYYLGQKYLEVRLEAELALISAYAKAVREYTKAGEDEKADQAKVDLEERKRAMPLLAPPGMILSVSVQRGRVLPRFTRRSILLTGGELRPGEVLTSGGSQFRLELSPGGNLVLESKDGEVLWISGTSGRPVATCVMQRDGNLVLRTARGRPVWASNTAGSPNSHLAVQDDGNLVIYRGDRPVWATGTNRGPSQTLQP